METPQIHRLLQDYWAWLKSETELREANGYVEITTPCLDHHNDHIQIYALQEDSGWLLTDDGYTIRDLLAGGCDVMTDRRQKLLRTALKRLGVELQADELIVRATPETFPQKKHRLLQAIIAVGDLFYTASSTVTSIFLEEVEHWLRAKEIRFTESVKFAGKSGYDHHFDFVIPASREAPERVLRVINRPNRASVERFIMAWLDTKDVRPDASHAVAVLNDEAGQMNHSAVEALASYDIGALSWSMREGYAPELAA